MLFSPVGTSRLQRIQGAYIDEAQIAKLTELWRRQGEPELREELLEEVEPEAPEGAARRSSTPTRTRCSRRDRARRRDADRVDLDAPAPPAARLHARRADDRHARAPRRDLRLRGLEAAPGADHRGRPAARARGARRVRSSRRVQPTSLPAAMPEIGATLREARMRARIDVSEIEAQTKIRAKYLRALENEEWGLLPGPDVREELPAHLRAGARPRRQGARRGVPPAARAPERGDARADRLHAAAHARSGARRRAAPRAATSPRSARSGCVIVLLIVPARRRRRLARRLDARRRRSRVHTHPRRRDHHAAERTARAAAARRELDRRAVAEADRDRSTCA